MILQLPKLDVPLVLPALCTGQVLLFKLAFLPSPPSPLLQRSQTASPRPFGLVVCLCRSHFCFSLAKSLYLFPVSSRETSALVHTAPKTGSDTQGAKLVDTAGAWGEWTP